MITECPKANTECPYFNRSTPGALHETQEHGCFADTDHKIPRFMGRGASSLLRNYIRSEDNQQQLCRHEHDIKTAEERNDQPELPSDRFMIDTLVRLRANKKLINMGAR